MCGLGFWRGALCICPPRVTVNNVSSVTVKKEEKGFWNTEVAVLQLSPSLDLASLAKE